MNGVSPVVTQSTASSIAGSPIYGEDLTGGRLKENDAINVEWLRHLGYQLRFETTNA